MARGLPGEVYSVDVDVQTLQVGQLRVGTGEPLQFVCADAHELPFADGSFDVAVLFASLHHFHDPVRCLTGLRRVLKRDGLLAIMCEPVGVYHDGHVSEEFRRELEQGINEQIFTAEEYAWMFGRAGLYVTWAEIDRGSFKAFLTPDVPEPAMAPLPRVGGWRVLARRVRERLRRMKARLLGRQSA
jgi:SAM-dependent methyltransferase